MALNERLVDRALAEAVKRAENLDYFFDQLSSPEWIEPLQARGFFSEPPAQEIEGGYIKAPPWSPSRYLARVAAEAPQQVAELILGIDSNNERVHEDFVDAALAMPAEWARLIASYEARWIAARDHLYYLLPSKTASLIEKLGEAGEVDAAITLIRVLFEPQPDRREGEWILRHAQARFSDWDYDRLLRDVIPQLTALAPHEILVTLAGLLEAALRLLAEDDGVPPSHRYWRTRIASDEERAINVEDALVSALRDAAVAVRASALLDDDELLHTLGSRDDEVFRRVLMHALAQEPAPTSALVHGFVMNLEEFVASEPSPEYRDLLSREATRLATEDLSMLLAVVERGPDIERYRELAEKYGGTNPTEADVAGYVARWQLGRLQLLQSALPPDWAARRRHLIEAVGDYKIGISGEVRPFVGPTSPISPEQFLEMEDDRIIQYLREWVPEERWDAPSVEGLARVFSTFVDQNPSRASRFINGLRVARPAYIQWAMHGLEQAVRRGDRISWPEVLELAEWVVGQPRERPGGREDEYEELDPGWVWTRRAIASLVASALHLEGDQGIGFDERARVWRITSAIAEDPDPTPEDEERYGGSNMDPATLALNTARPRAIEAAVDYAYWVYTRLTLSAEPKSPPARFFAEVPEVADLLTRHLDANRDPSEAVRGAIGQRYANLFALDPEWAIGLADLLFPDDDSALREAAWGAFVIYNAPYNNVLAGIRSKYLRSAELAGASGHGFRWMNRHPRLALADHLATFYWRGVVELDDDLLATYWAAAPAEAKAHMVEFLGRSAREGEEVSEDVVRRLLAFWKMLSSDASPDQASLEAFSWWFGARSLPSDWRLNQLESLIAEGVVPQPAYLVAEALSDLSEDFPLEAIRVTRRLLELERERNPWAIDAGRESIEKVLAVALGSSIPEAVRLAEEMLHWLGALGYRQFRSLAP